MRKRNAILLGSVFLLMLAGYVAWCWRPFYSQASIKYEHDVPREALDQVERWRLKTFSLRPFLWKDAYYLLNLPYIRENTRLKASFNPDYRAVYIKHPASSQPVACFIMESGIWRGYDALGKPLDLDPKH